jgi:hypothetical protein
MLKRFSPAVVMLLVLGTALPASARPRSRVDASALLAKAQEKMEGLDYEGALPLLKKALASGQLVGREKSTALLSLGITYVNVGREAEGQQAFQDALVADAEITLPKRSPPKVKRLFAAAQDATGRPRSAGDSGSTTGSGAPADAPPKMMATDAPLATPAPMSGAVQAAAGDNTLVAPAPEGKRQLGWPIGLGVVAVAAGAAGAVFAIEANNANSQLKAGGFQTSSAASSALSREQSMATLSFIGYGVAGAAAVGALATLLWGPTETPTPRVSVAPTAAGGLYASASMGF